MLFFSRNMRLTDQLRGAFRAVLTRSGSIRGAFPLLWKIVRRDGMIGSWRTAMAFWEAGAPLHKRNDYASWILHYDTLTPDVAADLTARAANFSHRPLVSILMPTYNAPAEWLVEAIESVRRQIYVHWELCIADDASTAPHVREILERYASADDRIKICLRTENGHISATTNSALALAAGEWLALLDHDDLLSAAALFWAVDSINRNPDCQLIYTDEDRISEVGVRFGPYFKPDWNPELFLSQNVFSHLGIYRSELVREVGGFRLGYEGSQDYDLALRCVERVRRDQVVHIPRVLYHWRVHRESTSYSSDAKPYAVAAAERALNDHLARTGVGGTAAHDRAGYRIRYLAQRPEPRVAVIISGESDPPALHRCIRTLMDQTSYGNYVVFVQLASLRDAGKWSDHDRVEVIQAGPQAIATAALRARDMGCSVVCLVDASTEFVSADWLSELVSHAGRRHVGLVGARLVSSNGKIASAGVVLKGDSRGAAGDSHHKYPVSSGGYGGRARLTQLYSAVRSTCAAMRIEVFDLALPKDRSPGAATDLEMCSRITSQGLDIVWTPFAEVVVHGPLPDLRWPSSLPVLRSGDPAYSPNLHNDEIDFSLAWPPRQEYFGEASS
jgi:glycosyltransferase involved in cell wall biosynthesis